MTLVCLPSSPIVQIRILLKALTFFQILFLSFWILFKSCSSHFESFSNHVPLILNPFQIMFLSSYPGPDLQLYDKGHPPLDSVAPHRLSDTHADWVSEHSETFLSYPCSYDEGVLSLIHGLQASERLFKLTLRIVDLSGSGWSALLTGIQDTSIKVLKWELLCILAMRGWYSSSNINNPGS